MTADRFEPDAALVPLLDDETLARIGTDDTMRELRTRSWYFAKNRLEYLRTNPQEFARQIDNPFCLSPYQSGYADDLSVATGYGLAEYVRRHPEAIRRGY